MNSCDFYKSACQHSQKVLHLCCDGVSANLIVHDALSIPNILVRNPNSGFSPQFKQTPDTVRQAERSLPPAKHQDTNKTGGNRMEKREQAFSVPEHARDVNSKEIFKNPKLCSQFLQDNMDIRNSTDRSAR